MSSDVEKLKAARELIARPGGWTQEANSRRADGSVCSLYSSQATCFCMGAAFEFVGGCDRDLDRLLGFDDFVVFNDLPGRTQAEVVAAFDKAIALAEASHV